MPLFSDHISNMYYSGSTSYTSSPYSYSSAASPYGSSYSASYLHPGGNYSSHSSLGGYTRAPLSSRWLTSGGRAYSPILSTISEKGTSSPVRINSPRRIPITGRSYVSPTYTSRPININTADIDVSRDKYRKKLLRTNSTGSSGLLQKRESPLIEKENGHDKPDTGIDTSPGPGRSTIKRDRAVVRLHTIKRKERDSPRKPIEVEVQNKVVNNDSLKAQALEKQTESKKWREKLADDLAYKTQKEKKTLGAKLVEKFTLKDRGDGECDNSQTLSPKSQKEISPEKLNDGDLISHTNKSVDRRCSMELLAEQASLLDSLIRRENLSTVSLDLSKIGADNNLTTDINLSSDDTKKRKLSNPKNRLATTKSDHSLHDRLSSKDTKDLISLKRRSLRKCSSGGNIFKLDSIQEIPKKDKILDVLPVKNKTEKVVSTKPKIKTKITSTVEVTSSPSQLKFIVENVTVEEKTRPCKKDIIFSSTVDENPSNKISSESEGFRKSVKFKNEVILQDTSINNQDHKIIKDKKLPDQNVQITKRHRKSLKSKIKDVAKPQLDTSGNLTSPEPDDGNFWEKIGKRETIYLIKRKQNIEEAKEENKRLFWFPAEDNVNTNNLNNETDNKSTIDKHAFRELTLEELNRNIETSIPAEETESLLPNKVDSKKSPDFTTDYKDLSNFSIEKDITNYVEKKDILGDEKILNNLDLTKSDDKISKTRGSKKESKKENNIADKLKYQSKIDQKLEVTEEIKKSKKIININKPEQSDSTKKSKDIKKIDTDEQMKDFNEVEHLKISSPKQVSLKMGHSSVDNETESNDIISNIKLNNENSTITVKLETTTECLDLDQDIKSNSKADIKSSTTILHKNNVEPIPINEHKNFNIPDATPIESSIEDFSLKTDKDNEIIEILETKAQKSEMSTFSNSQIDNNTLNNKSIKDKQIAEKDTNIDVLNFIDDKTVSTERCKNIEEEITSKTQETNETTEKKINNQKTGKPDAFNIFANMKPPKEEKALKTLIATPRPLQKRNPQTIRSSSSSESSDDDSSEDTEEDGDKDEAESGSSQGSAEYLECENNPDGRKSTGSADSGFDSSAPTSPSGFLHAKKDCDVNCHRKCEKLTANLCGVNQRLLVEALASQTASKRGGDSPSTSAGASPPQTFTPDVLEQELENSTAYDLFRKTGRFTPPARSIPRFRKYTIEDFQFIRVLGKGSFGKVMLAELRGTEYYYAVKCLKKDVVLEDDDVECTLIERKVLALGTNHPYLCHLFATFQTDSHLFFVMEYLNGGDLMFHIQQSGRFPEVRARFYAAEIVSGLKFLHKRGIVYRDLKLDNILLDFDGHVRIADFGMCKLQIYLDKTADTFCGTPDYMAPEIIKGLKYNQTVDWWSFGVLLYEMLIGQSPFSGCDEDELFWSICNEMPSYPRFLSAESLSILTRLLDKDARTRLGGPECMHGEIRDQKFFEQIHWERLERRELEAPFKPRVRHPMDTQYFDRAFTGERPRLTAVEPQVLRSMDQEPFRGFSYTNPNATDR